MIGAFVIAAVALILLGAVCGFLVVVSLGIHREKDMTIDTSDRIARGARVANGVHARRPGALYEAVYHHHDLPSPTDREWRQ